MVSMGVVRAEGVNASSALGTDKVVVQRVVSPNTYSEPKEVTLAQVNTYVNTTSLAGHSIIAAGTATLVAGTVTVAMPSIATASIVLISVADATPNAIGYTINNGVSLVITSADGTDTSKVSYLVMS